MHGPKFSSVRTDADRANATQEYEEERHEVREKMAQQKAARLSGEADKKGVGDH